jgi:uncharacterized protein YvpB
VILRSLLLLLLLGVTFWAPQQDAISRAVSGPSLAGESSSYWVHAPLTPYVLPTARVLQVPWYHQQHRLSCEAAALRMALALVGVKSDELTLMRFMGNDPRPARFDAKGRLVEWGDPNQAYVGNPDGSIQRYTGYGVYFAPVARAVVAAGAGVIASGSVGPQAVYNAVLAGHPVVTWISNTYHRVPLSSYVAYDGRRVYYTLTEHAVTVVGVRPGGVLINDPWFGPAWHSKAQFESAYATFTQMAVIVGP